MTHRGAEVAANLGDVRARIAAACAAAGRDAGDVELVAITKTFPLTDVEHLAAAGQHVFGESRDQEGRAKAAARADLEWHFVGRLQTNKARSVGGWARVVESFDRAELAAPLARGAAEVGAAAPIVLIQVSLDGDPERGGARPADVARVAAAATAAGLDVRGVMAVAPLRADPQRAFAQLRSVRDGLSSELPGARWISAGMSGDLEAAVAEGATHVRIGSALLGRRPPPTG
ncbi:MAG TPA: YggS family pyridoxal phosphate-dependent enzyme [Mycobacteriales bacterium]|nr:YggS family pyridoxal phosphate-dependent enzyme [Mycobacteriales bacterium]